MTSVVDMPVSDVNVPKKGGSNPSNPPLQMEKMNVWVDLVVHKSILRFHMCWFFTATRWRDGCSLEFWLIFK